MKPAFGTVSFYVCGEIISNSVVKKNTYMKYNLLH